MKTLKKNVNRKQIKFDKLDSFDLGVIGRVIHNRLYLKNESPTLKKIHEILVEHMDFLYKRENLRLLLIKMGFKFTRRGKNSLIHERQDLIAERAKFMRRIREIRKSHIEKLSTPTRHGLMKIIV